ncbi:MAG: type II toxin-antitoxin system VapC family toxin [Acidobacteriota bacterium]
MDTNIVIAVFANDSTVQARLTNAPEVFVPAIVLGELYYGAHKSSRVADNIQKISEFAANNAVLTIDTATAQEYGRIKNSLRAKGRPIPENDIWIAAIAMQYDLTLVTRDGHFGEVDGLGLENW